MQVALLAHGVSPHVTSAMTRTRSASKTSVVRNGKQLLCVSLYITLTLSTYVSSGWLSHGREVSKSRNSAIPNLTLIPIPGPAGYNLNILNKILSINIALNVLIITRLRSGSLLYKN